MPEVLDNPVIKDEVDISDEQFLEAARLVDKGEDVPAELISAKPADARAAEPEKPEKEPSAKPDNSETAPEKPKVERPRDELGRFTKTETGEDIPESERKPAEQEKPTDTKPETPYSKAQKEEQRAKGLLENFQKEKEAFRAESERIRKQLQQEAEQLRQAREQRTAPTASNGNRPRYSSVELLDAANTFESDAEKAFEAGDGEAFKRSLTLAREARAQAGQVYQLEQQAVAQQQQHRFQTVYSQVIEQAMKAEPELAKADSPLSKSVQELLEQEQVFSAIPDGFAKAVAVAKWKRDAGTVSELRETNKKLQAEIDRLNGLTQLNGSGPTSPPSQKSFESMSPDEQEKYLMRAAAKFDTANN